MSAPVTPSVRSQLMRLSLILILVSVTLSCAGSLSLTLQSERKVLGRGLLTSASILAETSGRPSRAGPPGRSWRSTWTAPPPARPTST